MIEALSSSETSVLTRAKWHNIPEGAILHSHCSEHLKSYIVVGLTFHTAISLLGRRNGLWTLLWFKWSNIPAYLDLAFLNRLSVDLIECTVHWDKDCSDRFNSILMNNVSAFIVRCSCNHFPFHRYLLQYPPAHHAKPRRPRTKAQPVVHSRQCEDRAVRANIISGSRRYFGESLSLGPYLQNVILISNLTAMSSPQFKRTQKRDTDRLLNV
jgi:hypothetical protein